MPFSRERGGEEKNKEWNYSEMSRIRAQWKWSLMTFRMMNVHTAVIEFLAFYRHDEFIIFFIPAPGNHNFRDLLRFNFKNEKKRNDKKFITKLTILSKSSIRSNDLNLALKETSLTISKNGPRKSNGTVINRRGSDKSVDYQIVEWNYFPRFR